MFEGVSEIESSECQWNHLNIETKPRIWFYFMKEFFF